MTLEQSIEVFGRSGLMAAPIPAYLQSLKAAGMEIFEPTSLVRRHLTGTAQASEAPFAGEPEPLNLPYRHGHTPQGKAERDTVIQAAGPWGAVGSANDARHHGQPYVLFIERKDHSHEVAHRAVLPALAAAAAEAWAAAQRGSRAA